MNIVPLTLSVLTILGNGVLSQQIDYNSEDFAATPASYAFSIWTLIYINLVVSSATYDWKSPSLAWLALSCAANLGWLYFWKDGKTTQSLVCLVIITIACWMILATTKNMKRISRLGFGVYAGWVTVATVLNLAILLRKRKKITEERDTQLGLFVAVVLCILPFIWRQTRMRSLPSIPFTWAWAAFAIYVKNKNSRSSLGNVALGATLINAVNAFVR